MKNKPDRIFLNLGLEDSDITEVLDFRDLYGVSWSEERVFKHDIEYTLADDTERLEPTRLQIKLMREALRLAVVQLKCNEKQNKTALDRSVLKGYEVANRLLDPKPTKDTCNHCGIGTMRPKRFGIRRSNRYSRAHVCDNPECGRKIYIKQNS